MQTRSTPSSSSELNQTIPPQSLLFSKILCPYKNLLGEPNKNDSLRKYRIFGISIMDVAVVIFVCYLISYFFKYSFWITLVITFLLGIIVHRLFCVRTRVDRLLFPNSKE